MSSCEITLLVSDHNCGTGSKERVAYSVWQEREGIGWFVLFVSVLWLNQTNQRNEMNQINQANHERRTGRRRLRAVYLVC